MWQTHDTISQNPFITATLTNNGRRGFVSRFVSDLFTKSLTEKHDPLCNITLLKVSFQCIAHKCV